MGEKLEKNFKRRNGKKSIILLYVFIRIYVVHV